MNELFSNVITFDRYQEFAAQTASYPDDKENDGGLKYLILGLAAEAGEVAGKAAKQNRDKNSDYTDPEFVKALHKEIGDCLWFISEIARRTGVSLSGIAQGNLKKLHDRQARGVISGSGDNR